jgi:hypothetical protein
MQFLKIMNKYQTALLSFLLTMAGIFLLLSVYLDYWNPEVIHKTNLAWCFAVVGSTAATLSFGMAGIWEL